LPEKYLSKNVVVPEQTITEQLTPRKMPGQNINQYYSMCHTLMARTFLNSLGLICSL
jgi:hypothetical protein